MDWRYQDRLLLSALHLFLNGEILTKLRKCARRHDDCVISFPIDSVGGILLTLPAVQELRPLFRVHDSYGIGFIVFVVSSASA